MLIAAPAFAQSVHPGWVADARTGCRVWSATPQPNRPVAWLGECLNGLPPGPGVLQWLSDGHPRDHGGGQLQGGPTSGPVAATLVASGQGLATWVNGNRYSGEWRDGKKNGRGVQVDADGSRYDGQWRNDLPNGRGTLVLSDGDGYSGVWVNGCYRHGSQVAWFDVDSGACH
jgi:hypothetical protein